MMVSRVLVLKICLLFHVIEVVFGVALAVLSFLLQKTANVDLKAAPSWAGIPFALLGLIGIIVIVLNKHKDELVFVLVFHGLIVVLCFISLVLVAPSVGRWKNVGKYQKTGECNQLRNHCNCTETLPKKVYKCTDLEHIYSLALMIAVFSAFSFVIAAVTAYLNFYIIKTFSALKDEPLTNTSSTRKEQSEDDFEISQYEGMGHIGQLSTPDLLPKRENEIIARQDSLEWSRSEADLQWQESPRNPRNSFTSAASLPMGNGVAGARSRTNPIRERALSMPNSVAGSKTSIRSRKDHLLRRLQTVQSNENEQPHSEDENEEIILNAIQSSSRGSLRKSSPQTAAISTPTHFPPQQNSPRRSEADLPEASFHSQQDSPAKGNESDGVAIRHESPFNSPRSDSRVKDDNDDTVKVNGEAELEEGIVREPRPKTGRPRNHLKLSRLLSEETFGLPPLPLKGSQTGLSVAERTFSAPALPFIDPKTDVSPAPNLLQRPGSSGSQVVARSKREHNTQTRNELIDTQMLHDDEFLEQRASGRFGRVRDSVSDDGSVYQMRKTSYETTSTDVGIIDDGKTETSDSTDENKKPRWHPPWQLKQEIVAHRDSVPILAIEPKNRWFASGSSDRSMKIWDINTGACRLTVKDHKAGIRAMTFGITGHRFVFSAGDDRQLLCTDIEVNRVIHKYPDQSSVIYAMTMYAPSELLVTCGRDKHVKIWDTREQKCVKTMRGHINTVSSLAILENSRQIISGSHDSTMRIWDIGEGRCTQILMGHEKSVRSIVVHPEEPYISSASTERIIQWSMPEGEKKQEITPKDISINCISVNPQGALVAAGSNGVIHLWDWKTGHKFQKIHRTKVYESQEVPICVFCVAFDKSGSRLIVSDASNVIKVYREAYTRVRRRHNLVDGKSSKKKGNMFSKFPTPDYAFM